ncbi:hypothetical protein ACSBLW_14955 [Thioclava sp. FR2]|uniref:hypothetical protein n=1 Tax=Thioclava sp. FR2 TaxID=3445780 RepID=UPI003EBB0C70
MKQVLIRSFLVAAGLAISSPLLAQDSQAPAADAAAPESQVDAASIRAHDIALGRLSQELSHEMMAGLQLSAWATAAAGLCADLTLDEGALYADIVKAAHDDLPDGTPEEMQRHRDFSLIAFGVLTGMKLEDAAANEAAFCAEAVEIAIEAGDDFYVQQIGTAVQLPEGN